MDGTLKSTTRGSLYWQRSAQSEEEQQLLKTIKLLAQEFARLVFEDAEGSFRSPLLRHERNYSFQQWDSAHPKRAKTRLDIFDGFLPAISLRPLDGLLCPPEKPEGDAVQILSVVHMALTCMMTEELDAMPWSRKTLVLPLAREHSPWSKQDQDVWFLGVTIIRERFARAAKQKGESCTR